VLWVVIIVMCLAALAAVTLPLIRVRQPVASRGAFNRQVYRDQLRELETDLAGGVVTSDEAAGARLEIERRLLATAEEGMPARCAAAGRHHRGMAASLAILIPAAGLGLYLWHGSPHQPGTTIANRPHPPVGSDSAATPGDLGQRVTHLAARLEDEPNDTQGWLLLGRSYSVLARHAEAAKAFRRATVLAPRDANVHTALGEALVRAANGAVEGPAVKVFRAALALKPSHPSARYYLALGRAQAGAVREAFDMWQALYRDTPTAAPWRPALEARLKEVAAGLGIEVASVIREPSPDMAQPPPNRQQGARAPRGPSREEMAAAAQMTAGERATMIRGMVDGLAARLKEDPDDADGWLRLARAYRTLDEKDKARDAMAAAARLRSGDVAVLLDYVGTIMGAAGDDGRVPPAALPVLHQILALDADNPGALYYMGLVAAAAGRTAEAEATWRRLLDRLDPGSPSYATVQRQLNSLSETR